MTDIASQRPIVRSRFGIMHYLVCLKGILIREGLRYLNQRERFISSLVRPLLWLFIFAAGFRQVLGVSIIPPYQTYVLYEVYITPGPLRHDPFVQRHAILAVHGL
jgi:ABC-2 type transport system permease protein